jgi:hypothetical protein
LSLFFSNHFEISAVFQRSVDSGDEEDGWLFVLGDGETEEFDWDLEELEPMMIQSWNS